MAEIVPFRVSSLMMSVHLLYQHAKRTVSLLLSCISFSCILAKEVFKDCVCVMCVMPGVRRNRIELELPGLCGRWPALWVGPDK